MTQDAALTAPDATRALRAVGLHLDPAVLDSIPAAVYLCDADGRIAGFNTRAAALWGRFPVVGDPDHRYCGSLRLFKPDGSLLPHEETPMATALRTGEPQSDKEVTIERPDGSRVVVLVHIKPLQDSHGRVLGAINCFQDITARHLAEARLRASQSALQDSERRFADLVEALPAAIYTTDATGRITFWNKAAEELWGRRPDSEGERWCGSWKLYRPDGTALPHNACPMAQALAERRPIRNIEAVAERPDGSRISFLPFPTPLHDRNGEIVGAVNMLVDITERKRAEQFLARSIEEQRALYLLTDRLHRALTREDIYSAGLEAIRRALRCQRASVLLFDSAGVMRFVAWHGLSDAYRQATDGHSPWQRDAIDPQPITVNDVAVAGFPEPLQSTVEREGIGAMAFVPLVTDGKLVGKFMAYYDAPHRFTEGEIDLATTIARQLGFGVERLRAEEARRQAERQRDLLIAELNHRVKNTLATVISIAGRSFTRDRSLEESRQSFNARLRALAQTHSRLAEADWSGVSLQALMEDELAPYRRDDGSNLCAAGPDVRLHPRCALTLGMTLHELVTNAAKHGALSAKGGSIEVRWELVDDRSLRILWRESGGPAVTPPAHSGFGRLLLERAVASDLGGKVALDFDVQGLRCAIAVPLSENVTIAA